jgi:hypothetical protein
MHPEARSDQWIQLESVDEKRDSIKLSVNAGARAWSLRSVGSARLQQGRSLCGETTRLFMGYVYRAHRQRRRRRRRCKSHSTCRPSCFYEWHAHEVNESQAHGRRGERDAANERIPLLKSKLEVPGIRRALRLHKRCAFVWGHSFPVPMLQIHELRPETVSRADHFGLHLA